MENRGKREGNYQVLDELGTLLITNFPSRSVVVPIDVPLTNAVINLPASRQVNNSVSFLFI